MKIQKKIAIIGTGLSGLAAGIELSQNTDLEIHYFEKNESVGGRVNTQIKDGFILDKGFQVILSGYPHFKEYIHNVSTRALARGATFVIEGEPITVDFSLKGAVSFLKNWRKIGTVSDFVKLISSVYAKPSKNIRTSLDLISSMRFSEKFRKNFLEPFFRGVLNSTSIETNVSYFTFLLKMFSQGPVVVPVAGMNEMPRSMQRSLETKSNVIFSFGKTISEITSKSIRSSDGDLMEFDHVICATDVWTLPKIAGARLVEFDRAKETSLTTFYVSTKNIAYDPKLLILPVGKYKINHIAPLADVYRSNVPYLSVNVLDTVTEFNEVQNELAELFSKDKSCFTLIKEERVEHVLPKTFYMGDLALKDNGIYYCGDYLETPSIDGALLSGKKVANQLLSDLQ